MTKKCVVILQARMNSSRLPGKVLMDIGGQPMLAQQLRRISRCKFVDEIFVATTTEKSDKPIEDLAKKLEVRFFRGSEMDVLSRFVGAAQEANADIVVRLTADCPLIDPDLIDKVIDTLIRNSAKCDYATNTLERTYPRGLDVEVMFADTLFRVDRLAKSQSAREHVTTFIRAEHPELFMTYSVKDKQDNSDLRWTVDTSNDLEFVRMMYESLNLGQNFLPYKEMLKFLRTNPHLIEMNANVETWDPTQKK